MGNPFKEIAGVCSVMEPLRTISNSCVKRNSGDDTTGVALWDNSSMPALSFHLVLYFTKQIEHRTSSINKKALFEMNQKVLFFAMC